MMPVMIVFIVKYFRFREKQLEAGRGQDPRLLEQLERERKMLEERVQNLESIVCSVDFELNARLNRLASGLSQAYKLPPAALAGSGVHPIGAVVPVAANAGGAPASQAAVTPVFPKGGETRPEEPPPPRGLGELRPGESVLGRYTIEREIGRGGMGAVYLARDAQLGDRVALKVISALASDDPQSIATRFRREVAQARKITHPNVIRIHDIGEDNGLLFLSMEYIEGQTLAERLRRGGPLPIPDALSILGEVALGVAAAHAAGVVHRDLKPHNVLLAERPGQRVVKVIDFGLATSLFLAGMTATGMILGTPEYMAPEQVRGVPSDLRTDVYALGVMAYHVFCGRPPFSGETPIAVGFAHLHQEPRPPRELRPDLPASIEAAILRALSKEPTRRFADAQAWRNALLGS
jgi:serine/threonine-protein kinase